MRETYVSKWYNKSGGDWGTSNCHVNRTDWSLWRHNEKSVLSLDNWKCLITCLHKIDAYITVWNIYEKKFEIRKKWRHLFQCVREKWWAFIGDDTWTKTMFWQRQFSHMSSSYWCKNTRNWTISKKASHSYDTVNPNKFSDHEQNLCIFLRVIRIIFKVPLNSDYAEFTVNPPLCIL